MRTIAARRLAVLAAGTAVIAGCSAAPSRIGSNDGGPTNPNDKFVVDIREAGRTQDSDYLRTASNVELLDAGLRVCREAVSGDADPGHLAESLANEGVDGARTSQLIVVEALTFLCPNAPG